MATNAFALSGYTLPLLVLLLTCNSYYKDCHLIFSQCSSGCKG